MRNMADSAKKQKLKKQHSGRKSNKAHQPQTKHDEAKERLKMKIMHDFNKLKRKKQPQGIDVQRLYAEMSDSDKEGQSTSKEPQSPKKKFGQKKEMSRFSKAQREHQIRAEKKRQKQQQLETSKREREAALEMYKKKKKQKFLKLCKRTPKGQPVMKYQMQFLVDRLEQQQRQSQSNSQS